MSFNNPFSGALPGIWGDYLSSALPDFILAFAFFTAVAFAVLSRRFQVHRATVAMSGAIGMALATGLVWWEQANDYSIRDLGPIAVGIALILLAMVLHQAVKQIGGTWAGAGIAIGASLLIGKVLASSFPVDWQLLQTIATVALVLGVLAFFAHRHGGLSLGRPSESSFARKSLKPQKIISGGGGSGRHEFAHDKGVSERLFRGMKHLRNEVKHDGSRPGNLQDITNQIRRMLPEEGWLTQRLAGLREKIEYIRRGELERVEDIAKALHQLTPEERARALDRMKKHYRESQLLVKLDQLDKAVAANEARIVNLTRHAQAYADSHDHQSLLKSLTLAEKLQKQNSQLFKWMNQVEREIEAIARKAAGHRDAGGKPAADRTESGEYPGGES